MICRRVSIAPRCCAVTQSNRGLVALGIAWVGCWIGSLNTLVAQESLTLPNVTFRLATPQRMYEGKPLAWDESKVALLRTNGRLSIVDRNTVTRLEKTADDFQPLSSQQIQRQLEQEFGAKYQVSVTPHFVVVHPPGTFAENAEPFEELYRRFRSYFWARGFGLENPEFPLVAVVLNSRAEFDRFLQAYLHVDPKIHGYYSPASNRVITYQQPAPAGSGPALFQRATLIHEATHQVAFNTGIHSRVSQNPRWVTEGLATMFEAKGVHNHAEFPTLSDRINAEQLFLVRKYIQAQQVRGQLPALLADDDLFRDDPLLAYSLAWAVSFYLVETHPADYAAYLKAQRDLPGFQPYEAVDRMRDFQRYFGSDLNQFELRLIQFLQQL